MPASGNALTVGGNLPKAGENAKASRWDNYSRVRLVGGRSDNNHEARLGNVAGSRVTSCDVATSPQRTTLHYTMCTVFISVVSR